LISSTEANHQEAVLTKDNHSENIHLYSPIILIYNYIYRVMTSVDIAKTGFLKIRMKRKKKMMKSRNKQRMKI
jgi:hypothetical protein